MTARTRKRQSYYVASSSFQVRSKPGVDWNWTNYSSKTIEDKCLNKYEIMYDHVSSPPYVDQLLNHTKFDSMPVIARGTCRLLTPAKASYEYVHTRSIVKSISYGDASLGHIGMSMPSTPQDYVNTALVKNNPGVPSVDLFAFIYELRELPALFSTLISNPKWRDVPIAYLFGVQPLVSDIRSLLNLTDSIDARLKQIEKLTQGPVRERLSLGNETRSASSTLAPGVYHGWYLQREKTTTRRAWAVKTSVIERNKLTPPEKPDTSAIRRLLLTDCTLVTLYELMPWSWFIDYFVNIQEFLRASSGNRIKGYRVLSLCLCVETETKGKIFPTSRQVGWSDGNVSPGRWTLLDQRRSIHSNPTPQLPSLTPILSSGQVQVLGALALSLGSNRRSIARRD